MYVRQIVVIQSCPPQVLVIELEDQWPRQVEVRSAPGAHPDGVSSIRRDHRSVEDHVQRLGIIHLNTNYQS